MSVHVRMPPRAGPARARSWWGRAWSRAVQEASYDSRVHAAGLRLARSSAVGGIRVEAGAATAAVEDAERGELWVVVIGVPVLDATSAEALVEVVAADPSRLPALLARRLPHELVEHAEEAGVELAPFGAELSATCSCPGWTDPCAHGLAVLHQLQWLVDADPMVLVELRGLSRAELVARVETRAVAARPAEDAWEVDLDLAADAAQRAAQELAALTDPPR